MHVIQFSSASTIKMAIIWWTEVDNEKYLDKSPYSKQLSFDNPCEFFDADCVILEE